MKLFCLLTLLISGNTLFAQIVINDKNEIIDLPTQDFDQITIDFNADNIWKPPSFIEVNPKESRGIHLYLSYSFTLLKNLNFSPGLGISSFNLSTNILEWKVDSTNNYYIFLPDSINFLKNKLSANYVEIPLEFRIHTNPNKRGQQFTWTIGFKTGYQFRSYKKIKYDDVKRKDFNINGLNPLRYGVITRIGFGRIYITAFYSLSTLFKKDFGPDLTPFSVGVSILTL